MKHYKPYYVLESRMPINEKQYALQPNKTRNTIGIYSKPEKAIKWIKKNGRTYFGKSKKLYFWCLCECLLNIDELIFYNYYDKNGKLLPFSSNIKDLKKII